MPNRRQERRTKPTRLRNSDLAELLALAAETAKMPLQKGAAAGHAKGFPVARGSFIAAGKGSRLGRTSRRGAPLGEIDRWLDRKPS